LTRFTHGSYPHYCYTHYIYTARCSFCCCGWTTVWLHLPDARLFTTRFTVYTHVAVLPGCHTHTGLFTTHHLPPRTPDYTVTVLYGCLLRLPRTTDTTRIVALSTLLGPLRIYHCGLLACVLRLVTVVHTRARLLTLVVALFYTHRSARLHTLIRCVLPVAGWFTHTRLHCYDGWLLLFVGCRTTFPFTHVAVCCGCRTFTRSGYYRLLRFTSGDTRALRTTLRSSPFAYLPLYLPPAAAWFILRTCPTARFTLRIALPDYAHAAHTRFTPTPRSPGYYGCAAYLLRVGLRVYRWFALRHGLPTTAAVHTTTAFTWFPARSAPDMVRTAHRTRFCRVGSTLHYAQLRYPTPAGWVAHTHCAHSYRGYDTATTARLRCARLPSVMPSCWTFYALRVHVTPCIVTVPALPHTFTTLRAVYFCHWFCVYIWLLRCARGYTTRTFRCTLVRVYTLHALPWFHRVHVGCVHRTGYRPPVTRTRPLRVLPRILQLFIYAHRTRLVTRCYRQLVLHVFTQLRAFAYHAFVGSPPLLPVHHVPGLRRCRLPLRFCGSTCRVRRCRLLDSWFTVRLLRAFTVTLDCRACRMDCCLPRVYAGLPRLPRTPFPVDFTFTVHRTLRCTVLRSGYPYAHSAHLPQRFGLFWVRARTAALLPFTTFDTLLRLHAFCRYLRLRLPLVCLDYAGYWLRCLCVTLPFLHLTDWHVYTPHGCWLPLPLVLTHSYTRSGYGYTPPHRLRLPHLAAPRTHTRGCHAHTLPHFAIRVGWVTRFVATLICGYAHIHTRLPHIAHAVYVPRCHVCCLLPFCHWFTFAGSRWILYPFARCRALPTLPTPRAHISAPACVHFTRTFSCLVTHTFFTRCLRLHVYAPFATAFCRVLVYRVTHALPAVQLLPHYVARCPRLGYVVGLLTVALRGWFRVATAHYRVLFILHTVLCLPRSRTHTRLHYAGCCHAVTACTTASSHYRFRLLPQLLLLALTLQLPVAFGCYPGYAGYHTTTVGSPRWVARYTTHHTGCHCAHPLRFYTFAFTYHTAHVCTRFCLRIHRTHAIAAVVYAHLRVARCVCYCRTGFGSLPGCHAHLLVAFIVTRAWLPVTLRAFCRAFRCCARLPHCLLGPYTRSLRTHSPRFCGYYSSRLPRFGLPLLVAGCAALPYIPMGLPHLRALPHWVPQLHTFIACHFVYTPPAGCTLHTPHTTALVHTVTHTCGYARTAPPHPRCVYCGYVPFTRWLRLRCGCWLRCRTHTFVALYLYFAVGPRYSYGYAPCSSPHARLVTLPHTTRTRSRLVTVTTVCAHVTHHTRARLRTTTFCPAFGRFRVAAGSAVRCVGSHRWLLHTVALPRLVIPVVTTHIGYGSVVYGLVVGCWITYRTHTHLTLCYCAGSYTRAHATAHAPLPLLCYSLRARYCLPLPATHAPYGYYALLLPVVGLHTTLPTLLPCVHFPLPPRCATYTLVGYAPALRFTVRFAVCLGWFCTATHGYGLRLRITRLCIPHTFIYVTERSPRCRSRYTVVQLFAARYSVRTFIGRLHVATVAFTRLYRSLYRGYTPFTHAAVTHCHPLVYVYHG